MSFISPQKSKFLNLMLGFDWKSTKKQAKKQKKIECDLWYLEISSMRSNNVANPSNESWRLVFFDSENFHSFRHFYFAILRLYHRNTFRHQMQTFESGLQWCKKKKLLTFFAKNLGAEIEKKIFYKKWAIFVANYENKCCRNFWPPKSPIGSSFQQQMSKKRCFFAFEAVLGQWGWPQQQKST